MRDLSPIDHCHEADSEVTTLMDVNSGIWNLFQCLYTRVKVSPCGFGGLEVACWPLVPKFADSNPAEAVGFFRAKKPSARLPSEGK